MNNNVAHVGLFYKSKLLILLSSASILGMVGISKAVVDLSITTDKTTYLLGEEVRVYVSAHNSGTDPVTLTFPSGLDATYWMDEAYYWHQSLVWAPMVLHLKINPNSTHTWERIHGPRELSEYPLVIGRHSVVGIAYALELQEYYTEPLNFEVVPEPASILLLSFGMIYIRRYKARKQ
jgi:intracellular proteinase inhibitor BsuPI